MWYLDIPFAAFAVIGHAGLGAGAVCRIHALRGPRLLLKIISHTIEAWVVLGFLAGVWWWLATGHVALREGLLAGRWPILAAYLMACGLYGVYLTLHWVWRRCYFTPTERLRENHTRMVDVAERAGEHPLGDWLARLLIHVPGNQVFDISVTEKTLALPRLPPALEGLTIAHLSDLHIMGHITRPFYEVVVEETNALAADVVVITGDIVESRREREWVPQLLARLNRKEAVFFVLGNHDKKLRDHDTTRRMLVGAGLTDLGSRCDELPLRGHPVVIAGNEQPWLGKLPDMNEFPVEEPGPGRRFRLLLSHSPDQIRWAQRHDFDLMLAGHTHGGQIQLPLIGPVLAPSRYGVKYASGTFYESPTLMHVSRGLGGMRPIRLNCPPELAKLTLRRGEG